ncbi:phosphatases II [Rhizopogon salebrosus TDB-379]|nr:phosphatases II [Rhizopogon salebrosus TDB-379]
MASSCAPLCHFGDRLYFTTFPHPAPSPQFLNSATSNPANAPKIRPQPQLGPPAGPSVFKPASPDDDAIYYYFTIDDQLLYTSFYQDWGPLNLAMVYKACLLIHGLLKDDDLGSHRLVLYSSDDPRRKANAALLMALYMLILHNYTPWRCFQPISELEFMSFRDAGRGPSTFNLSIYDCLWGFWKAMQNRLIDLDVFDLEDYEFHEKVENGDWNWITPNFIAFASPRDYAWTKQRSEMQAEGPASPARLGVALPNSPRKLALQRKLNPAFCICLDYFEKHKVDLVVRLNAELYDKQLFLDRGIKHLDLCFEDGSNPSDEIVRTFIDVADAVIEDGGVVAVHCKAGLGRTGTLIGAYLIWKYGFTASEAIAFMRIIRPGCVVGPQQHYMHQMQLQWARWSAADEIRRLQVVEVATAAAPVVTPATPPAEQDEVMHESRSSTPSTAIPMPLPPVTPGRAIVATMEHETPPPGQPRKTPMAKRVAIHSDDEDAEMEDTLPTLGVAPPVARPRARTTTRLSGARGTTSEQRPTRVLRSAMATTQQRHAAAAAARASRAAAPPPNKIPRLTAGTTARSTAVAAKGPGAPSARRVPQPPPSPTPSRLPTLAKKHNSALAELPNTRSSKPVSWMKAGANAIVMPPSKSSQRPGPRPVRRRRSSFSAADVVA